MACRGATLNSRWRCEHKHLSYRNKNWYNSTNFITLSNVRYHGSLFGGFRVLARTQTDGLRYFNRSSRRMPKRQSVAGKICNTTNAGGEVGCRTPRRSVPYTGNSTYRNELYVSVGFPYQLTDVLCVFEYVHWWVTSSVPYTLPNTQLQFYLHISSTYF
jgi:hypothetical protein